jgi:hypothetical protein
MQIGRHAPANTGRGADHLCVRVTTRNPHSSGIQPAGSSIAHCRRHFYFGDRARIVTRHRLSFAFSLLGCLMLACAPRASAMWSSIEVGPVPLSAGAMSDATRLAQTQPAPAPATAPSPDQAAADEPIGNVATLTGRATVTRNNAPTPVKLQDDIFLDDVLETSANSTLGVTFNDATTFNLTANAKITVDNFVYEDGGKQNAAQFDIAKGSVAFCRRRCQNRRHENIDADRDARHSRHHRPSRGAGRRLRRKREQCRHQALSRPGRQGRADRSQWPRRRTARFSYPGREWFYNPARRRRAPCRVAAGDLAAAGIARSGLRASSPRRAKGRAPDRHPAAQPAPAKSAQKQSSQSGARARSPETEWFAEGARFSAAARTAGQTGTTIATAAARLAATRTRKPARAAEAAVSRVGSQAKTAKGKTLEHDPEKCVAVFRKDHAQSKT